MSIIFRSAHLADATGLKEYCWQHHSIHDIRNLILRGRGQSISAVMNGQIVGFGRLSLWFKVVEISDLVIAPHVRGKGIGTELIVYLCNIAQAYPIEQIEIGAAQNNPRAQRLYEHLGFHYDRTIYLDLGQGLEAVNYLVKDKFGNTSNARSVKSSAR